MAVLKYYDPTTQQWLPLSSGGGTGGPDEVAIQPDEPLEHPDLWVDTDDDTGSGSGGGGGGLDQATADGLYVNVAGDTVDGNLAVVGNLTAAGQVDLNGALIVVNGELDANAGLYVAGWMTADAPIAAATAPTDPAHLTPKSYVDSEIASQQWTKITVDVAPPSNPQIGDIWVLP